MVGGWGTIFSNIFSCDMLSCIFSVLYCPQLFAVVGCFSDACPEKKVLCKREGYLDPRNCSRCKCPEGTGGDTCEEAQKGSPGQ